MSEKAVQLKVYGAEERCASCVNAPGSKETFEWLEAAIDRKYGKDGVEYTYVDIHTEHNSDEDRKYVEQILNDELLYPLVVINGEIAAEGIPRLKSVCSVLEQHGLKGSFEA
ncbi:YuzD family protein [Halobacillus shinanisalinarum]|uniref:YuzD family protein n=1 Tax=Halobacillus shinanisalinarum TaxID=2932258 RepID=A0ABY4H2V4_9BACI|nr:YuzD family protein [Halobacillus shinanisalinarum]UOQ94235.1 YuzD family protein [Halobacillus shinanisalinarum]